MIKYYLCFSTLLILAILTGCSSDNKRQDYYDYKYMEYIPINHKFGQGQAHTLPRMKRPPMNDDFKY